MKNQTLRLNAKTVNANLHRLQENTSFSRSRYEIQGRRQPESSGDTILEWGNRKSEVRRADSRGRSWRGAASLPPHQLGGLGSAVSTRTGLISWTEPGTNPARGVKLGQARML